MKFGLLASFIIISFLNTVNAEEFNPVQSDQFVASYAPAVNGKTNYGILVLGGSGGKIPTHLAKKFTSQGHSVMALAYFKEKGLPAELNDIPLEYFEQAKKWLMAQNETRNDGIILVGWSKGAELSLLLASRDKSVKKLVAIAPSSHVWAGILTDWTKTPSSSWTMAGKALDHIKFQPDATVRSLRDLYQVSFNKAENIDQARIKVENIMGSVLLFSGGKDTIWPASTMAAAVCDTMVKAGKNCVHHDYPDAGHLLDAQYIMGGTKETNASASEASAKIIRDYLK